MGRQEKTIARMKKVPADFTWDELCFVLARLGFESASGSGSRVKFIHTDTRRVISLHRPHPGNIVKKYVLRQVLETLNQEGILE